MMISQVKEVSSKEHKGLKIMSSFPAMGRMRQKAPLSQPKQHCKNYETKKGQIWGEGQDRQTDKR